MNYEEKYKNALERAEEIIRYYLEHNRCDETSIEDLKQIFPELAESEDEKIRKALIEYFNEQCDMSDWNGVYGYQVVAWLKKQGEQDAMETQNEEFDDNIITHDDEILQAISIGLTDIIEDFGWSDFGGLPIEEIQSWLEKKGEQKPFDYKNATIVQKDFAPKVTPKIEPKFKIGDYVVTDYIVGKIFAITDDSYLLDTGQGIPFSSNNVHLWTIQDAKDGDVLADSDGGIFIYAGSTGSYAQFYVALGRHGDLYTPDDTGNWEEKNRVYPAYKEQRDTLFAKMKEDGYKWDAEKKELKELKKVIIEPKYKVGDWICNGGGNPCKVNDIFGSYYELRSIEDYEYNKPISDIDANYHLWTIEDAKDHDILTVDGRPFIYCCNDNYKGNYCCIDSDGKFRPNLEFGFNGKTILPATKEQRDLILQMSENTPLNY